MASTTSKADDWLGRRTTLAAYGEALARRRAELGEPQLPRNSGRNRTESKKALLAAINEITDKQGWRW